MKKFYAYLSLMIICCASVAAQKLVLTNVVDGSCGKTSKFVEIYVSGTVNLSEYNLVRRSNSGNWVDDGVAIDLTDLGTKTDEFIYLIRDLATLNTEFPSTSITVDNSMVSESITHNGDDSYRIIEVATGNVIDQFGGDIDGTGETWEYTDSWASRNNDVGPNSTFTESEWTFYGIDILDDEGICNESNALENTVNTLASYTNSNLNLVNFQITTLKVYPNPVTGQFLNIDIPQNLNLKVSFYDMLGKLVYRQEQKEAFSVNVSHLQPGVYIASFTFEDNQSITKKIIIK